mmetsp:Transcript_9666/g.20595  ORF Transcript_9666/g.20595 Transcript_9666/m.20595 type:complete len:88 (+) Transcript_9666:569-832(+)
MCIHAQCFRQMLLDCSLGGRKLGRGLSLEPAGTTSRPVQYSQRAGTAGRPVQYSLPASTTSREQASRRLRSRLCMNKLKSLCMNMCL